MKPQARQRKQAQQEVRAQKQRPPPPSTVSGYPKRDVYRALGEAIAARDPTRACCLAAELASSPGESKPLASYLADTFATWHASADGAAASRLWSASSRVWRMEQSREAQVEGRQALCEAVIAMAVGLPRQDAAALVLEAAGSAGGHASLGCRPASSCDLLSRLASLVRRRDAAGAVVLAHLMLTQTTDPLAVRAVWDACLSASSERSPGIRAAYSLYHVTKSCDGRSVPPDGSPCPSPPKSVAARRVALALYAVLAASAPPGAAEAVPSTWAGASADALIERAVRKVDILFPPDDHGSSLDCAEDDDDDREEDREEEDDEQEEEEVSYLQLYTTYDHASKSRAPEARRDAVDAAPVRTVVLRGGRGLAGRRPVEG